MTIYQFDTHQRPQVPNKALLLVMSLNDSCYQIWRSEFLIQFRSWFRYSALHAPQRMKEQGKVDRSDIHPRSVARASCVTSSSKLLLSTLQVRRAARSFKLSATLSLYNPMDIPKLNGRSMSPTVPINLYCTTRCRQLLPLRLSISRGSRRKMG